MKKTFNYLAITSCFVLGTTFAHADSSQGKMQEKMFKAMDTNSDGMVTRDEFNTFGTKKFQEMDVNGNGQITLEEMKTWYKKMESGGRNKMDDRDMDSSGKARSQKDNANPMNDTRTDGRSNNSWTPNSGANRSGNMGNAWDKKRDDARNKKIDDDDDDDND